MHAGELFLILIFNGILIFTLYFYQKRLIEKNIRNLKKEIHELEDLVAAIIEEFEDIANPENKDKVNENSKQFEEFTGMSPQELRLNYPTVGDLLDNMEENELSQKVTVMEAPGDHNKEYMVQNMSAGSLTDNDEEIGETGGDLEKSQIQTPITTDIEEVEPAIDSIEESQHVLVSKPDTGIPINSISDPRHRRILELRQQGITVEDIARQLGTGRGEIQLVLGLYRRS